MKRILFYEPYGQWHLHVVWETTISHALKLRGANVKHVACNGLFPECGVYRENINPRNSISCLACQRKTSAVYEMMRMPYEWLGNYIPRHAYPDLKEWIHSIPADKLLSASWRGYPVGKWAKSSSHYQFRMSILNLDDPRVRQTVRNYVYGTALSIEGLIPLYDEWQPETLVLLNGRFFSHRAAMELAIERNIKVIIHERGKLAGSIALRENRGIHNLQIYQDTWEQWQKIPLNTDELDKINTTLENRRIGKGHRLGKPFSPSPQDKEKVRRELNLGNRPLIVLFSSSNDETADHPDHSQGAFPNSFDWLPATLALAHKFPHHIFVIRAHPNITTNGINQQALDHLLALRSDLPKNARIVMPADKISSYTLADMAEVGLVYLSTIGLEMAARGQPIVAVAKGSYGHRGFVKFVEKPAHYEHAIRSEIEQGRQLETARQARRFAYHMWHSLSIPFPLAVEEPRNFGKPKYMSVEDLMPGKDKSLDRICRYILNGEPLMLPPGNEHKKRTEAEEDQFYREILPELFKDKTTETARASKTAQYQDGQITKPDKNLASNAGQKASQDAQNPIFSVILTTHNRAPILLKCLDALAGQTLPADEFEVLVCDDGSTDDTQAVVKSCPAPYRLHYIRLDESLGAASSRNLGIQRAHGQLVLFINDDTYPEPDLLEQHLQMHQMHDNEHIAVLGHILFAPEHSERILSRALHQHNLLFPLVGTREEVPYDFNYFVTANLSVARQAFVSENIWFDETFKHCYCEDIEVGYRLWKHGYRVYYCPQAKVIHDHRLTVHDYRRREAANSSNLVQFVDKHPELVPRYLGVPRLTETVFDQWRQMIRQEAPVIKKMVDSIAAVENVTPAVLAGSTVTPSDAAELIRKIAVSLKHISEHIKRQTVLQILDDLPDVRYRLLSSTCSQPQSRASLQTNPLVSVVIPCYNYARYLPEAVSSVLNQTCQDFEIIIVNDGSPDDTKEVAKKLIAQNPQHQIRLINQANSGQPAIARNRGIAETKAEYILPLDADDKLAPQAIESYLRAVEDYPNQPVVVFGWLQRFGVEKNLWKTQSFSPNQLLHRTLLPYCSMYHRSVWEFQGGYATNVPGYEDWDFWIGAAEKGAKFVNVPLATTFYRRTAESSLVDSSRQKHEWLVAGIISNHPDIYEDEEVIWATDYLEHFPEAPEERRIHGQNDKFPKASAVLVVSYEELYIPEEVDWAKQLLRKNPFKILKGIKPGPVKVDASCKPKGTTDLDYFVKAGKEFTKGNFETAVEYMQKYRLMTDYSKLPRILSTSKENDEVAISVIVVTYNKAGDLKKCLESLSKQDSGGYEVIVVDNGQSDVEVFKQYIDQYIKCPINLNLSEGRNIGAHFARGRITVFLDDDALVGPNYISSIKSAFENFDIFGLRGRAYPKTSPDANNHINLYDLGDKPFPSYCNQEGNSAFLLEVYKKMQGMDPLLFGHEGSDLTYRIIKEYKLPNKIIYWPEAVIYHDYGIGDKFNQKKMRYLQNANYLKYKHNTDIFINRRSIEKYPIDLKQKKNWPNELYLDRAAPLFQGKPAARVPTADASHPQPKVSIIIPCYNSERFLPECLDSIRNQTMRQWELFLLDDASTDGTKSVIERYCRMDERIKPYYFQDNKGPYVRRNFAIEQANSDFILIQDADDIARPAKLEILYNEITKDAQLGIVGSFYRMFLIEFKGLKYTDKIGFPLTHDEIIDQYRSKRDFCWHGSAIIHKELFEAIGLYDENPFSSDSFWLAKAAVYAAHSSNIKLKNIPEFLTLKRAHPISQTGVLPTFDQRSKRAKFHIYWRYKLSKVIEKLHNNPNVDIKAELGNCKCNDYIERYGHLFEQWESEPLNNEMLNMLISIVVGLFNNCRYVSCIVRLEGMETMARNIAKRFKNYDLLRAITYFAIDMKQQSLECLNREIQNHNNQAAIKFISDYFENPSETDVYSWCLENGRFYNLQIIDLEDESGIEQRSCAVSDRHIPARQGKQVNADRNLPCGQKEPLVTVIMPVYNGANYIGEAIESVLIQNYPKLELVIVDDGSTDNTKEVVSRCKDERIKYIYKENGGPSSARNCAIRKAKGQYIIPLDSDDMMAPNFITLHLQEFEKYPETDLVYCDVLLIDGDGKPIKVMNKPEYQDRRHLIKDLFRQGHPVIPFRLGIRKRVFDKIGLYDETLMIGEDYDMMRRFVKAGLKAHHLSEALHLRRVQSNSLSRNLTAENAKLHFEVVKRFTDTFTYDELFPDVDWDKIAPEMRQMHAKCLAAMTYLAIGQEYVKSSSPAVYAKVSFEQACSELRSALKMNPENERIRQMLQKCELGKQKYTEQIQQAVC